jgi:hypothetical protein
MFKSRVLESSTVSSFSVPDLVGRLPDVLAPSVYVPEFSFKFRAVRSGANPVADVDPREAAAKGVGKIESRLDHKQTRLVDIAPFLADLHSRKAFGKAVGNVELRLNDELPRLVDVTPLVFNLNRGIAL